MKAAVFRAPGDVRIEEVPDPAPPGPGELLIRVSKAALCGTDSAEWSRGPLLARPPVVLGHEFTGEVITAGPEVPVPPGNRVVSGAGISCGHCAWCAALLHHLVRQLPDAWPAPRRRPRRVRAVACRHLPGQCPAGSADVGAAMAQPLAVALHAARRGGVGTGRSCAVIGAGGIGSFVIAAAAALGADPLIAVDIDNGRLATATVLGADITVNSGREDAAGAVVAATGGNGARVVIEASGAPASPAAALSMARRGGDVVIVGLQAAPLPVDLFSVSVREVNVHGTLAHVCGQDLAEAVAVLAGPRLAQTVLGDVIPLGDLVEGGLRPLAERKARGKIVVDVQGSV